MAVKYDYQCKGLRKGNVRCNVAIDPETELGSMGVCSKACYSSQFVPDNPPQEGLRYNEGKSRVDLIPAEVLLELGRLYGYGARKYAPNNWRQGLSYTETYGSLCRHLYAWFAGASMDQENNCHHLVSVIWNAMALFYFEMFPAKYEKFDDRVIQDYEDAILFDGRVDVVNDLEKIKEKK